MLKIITISGHQLDLYPDTVLSIEENSPVFIGDGSFSTPFNLPPTPGNLAALSSPGRYQRKKLFKKSFDVSVFVGTYHRLATMRLESVTSGMGISAVLYFRESGLYQKIRDVKLQELFKEDVRPISPISFLNHCNKVMCGDIEDDFYIFPVLLSADTKSETIDTATRFWTEYTIANQPAVARNTEWPKRVDKDGKEYVELKSKLTLTDSDGEVLEVPELYGIAPYLKLIYILRKSLEKIGYELEGSIMDTDLTFKKMCIIHPVVDACVTSELKYSQLLPDISLDEFLSTIENSFGVRFIADETNRKVKPVFLRDLLIDSPYMDITPMVEDGYELNYGEERSLKLTVSRNIPESKPLVFDTISEMIKKVAPYQESVSNLLELSLYLESGHLSAGLYLVRNSRMFYKAYKQEGQWKIEPVDRYLQDYYDNELSLSHEEFKMGFASAPSVLTLMSGRTVKSEKSPSSGGVYQDVFEYLSDMSELFPSVIGDLLRRAPYLGEVQHLNTVLKTTTTDDSGASITNYNEESELSPPLYLAFSHGRYEPPHYSGPLDDVFMGSQDAYTNTGGIHLDFDLSPPSLYRKFWTKYDKLLQTSFHELTIRPNFSTAEIMSFKYVRPISINGQLALPLSIRYELSDAGAEVVELTLRIIREYE